MDKVIIVPTMQNPWKEEKVLDIDKRLDIIEYSIMENMYYEYWIEPYKVEFSTIEKELIPPYYSYATLHALKNKYCNDEVFVLCGEDTMEKIPDWMNGGQIIKDYNFLIVDRPRNSISSTQIREMLRTRHKMDAYYSDEKLVKYVSPNVINLLKEYY
jgi:nicotinate-nucleotide adenylyltransferase